MVGGDPLAEWVHSGDLYRTLDCIVRGNSLLNDFRRNLVVHIDDNLLTILRDEGHFDTVYGRGVIGVFGPSGTPLYGFVILAFWFGLSAKHCAPF